MRQRSAVTEKLMSERCREELQRTVKNAGVKNPLLLLDEIDKVST